MNTNPNFQKMVEEVTATIKKDHFVDEHKMEVVFMDDYDIFYSLIKTTTNRVFAKVWIHPTHKTPNWVETICYIDIVEVLK